MRHIVKLTFFTAAALTFAGCGATQPQSTNVMKSPTMQEAIAAERVGEYSKAIALYKRVSDEYPSAALPNLQLALLLHEKEGDYLGAIYRYRRFIETAQGKECSEINTISNRIKKAEQVLAARYVSTISSGSASENVQLMHNIAALNNSVTKLEGEKAVLVSSNEALRVTIRTLESRATHLQLLIDKLKMSSAGVSGTTSIPGIITSRKITDDAGTTRVVQTYEVKSGDSLSRIAEYAYDDAKLWPKIRDANPDKVKGDRVNPGDVLIIPE